MAVVDMDVVNLGVLDDLTEKLNVGQKELEQLSSTAKSEFSLVRAEIKESAVALANFSKRAATARNAMAGISGQRGGLGLGMREHMEKVQNMTTPLNESMTNLQMTTNSAGDKVMRFKNGLEGSVTTAGELRSRLAQGGVTSMDRMLNQAQELSPQMETASQKTRRLNGALEVGSNNSKKLSENAGEAAGQFGRMFGIGMNLMFTGMALNMVFGRLARSMLSMTGASQALSASLKSALLPFFLAITPPLLQLSQIIMALPGAVKMLIGAMVGLLAVAGPLMMVAGQGALFWGQFGDFILRAVGSVKSYIGSAANAITSTYEWLVANSALRESIDDLGRKTGGLIKKTLSYATGAISTAITSTYAWLTATTALGLSLGSIALIIGSLALGIIFLQRVFKKFGPVVGFLATILTSALMAALSPIAAAVTAIFGAFKAVNMIFKKFGKVIGVIAGVVVAVIGGIIAVFASVPIGVALAVGAVLAIIWNFKDQIASAINAIVGFVAGLAKGFGKMLGNAANAVSNFVRDAVKFFKSLPKKANKFIQGIISKGKEIVNFFANLGSKITGAIGNAATWLVGIGKDMIQGLIKGIKSMGSMITNAIAGLLPEKFKKALNAAADFGGKALNAVTDVLTPNDFILTSGGKMIRPDQNDTIVGFNGNGPIQPGAGGGETNITINDPVVREEQDIDRIIEEVEKSIDRKTRGRSGGLT